MTYRQPFSGSYPITQYYGETVTSAFHTGIDYATPMKTPIIASADGVIRFSGWDKTGYGFCVIIEHDLTHSTLYAHLTLLMTFYMGQKVKQGDLLGYSGTTGNSTGPHLHFEARRTWNNYKSHFNPFDLPLMSVDDSIGKPVSAIVDQPPVPAVPALREASDLKQNVEVVAALGAYAHNADFTSKRVLYPGTELIFTGNTKIKDGLTFCECRPVTETVWVAVHNGEDQILDNSD